MERRARILAAVVGLSLVAGTVLMLVRPPIVVYDSAMGFAVGRSVERGSPLNERFVVDPADLSRDTTRFLAWWSPGQYVVPMAFERSGLGLGDAIVATTFLARAAALVGFFLLYRTLGFTAVQSLIALLLTAFHIRFLLGYVMYHGGGLLLLGFLPWVLLLALKVRRLTPVGMLALAGAFVVGAFLKLAFLIAAAAVVVALVLDRWRARPDPRDLALYGLRAAVVFAVPTAIVWKLYLAASMSHTETLGALSFPLRELLFATAAPVFSLFSSGDLVAHGLELGNTWTHGRIEPLLAVGTGLSIYGIQAILRARLDPTYKALVAGFSLTYVAGFAALSALDANVSFSYRHLLPCGMIVLPGLLEVVRSWRRAWLRKTVHALLVVAVAGATVVLIGSYFVFDRSEGSQGIAHLGASPELLDLFHDLDSRDPPGDALFAMPLPSLALEIEHHRTLNEGHRYWPAHDLARFRFHGRVDDLYLILASDQPAERKQALRAIFPDYPDDGWSVLHEGKWTVLHQPRPDGAP